MNREELIRRLRLGSETVGRRGWRCPDEVDIVAYADATLPSSRRQRLERHLSDCPYCLGQVGFAVRSQEMGPPTEAPSSVTEQEPSSSSTGWRGHSPFTYGWRLVSAAAALILAVSLSFWLLKAPGDSDATRDSTVRNVPSEVTSPTVLSPQEGDVLGSGSTSLRWNSVPQAIFYRVRVVTDTGDVKWEAQVEEASVALDTTADLEAGARYFVWVEAHLRGGGSLTSPVVGFRVGPPPWEGR